MTISASQRETDKARAICKASGQSHACRNCVCVCAQHALVKLKYKACEKFHWCYSKCISKI